VFVRNKVRFTIHPKIHRDSIQCTKEKKGKMADEDDDDDGLAQQQVDPESRTMVAVDFKDAVPVTAPAAAAVTEPAAPSSARESLIPEAKRSGKLAIPLSEMKRVPEKKKRKERKTLDDYDQSPGLWFCVFCCCAFTCTTESYPRKGDRCFECANKFCCLNSRSRCFGASCKLNRTKETACQCLLFVVAILCLAAFIATIGLLWTRSQKESGVMMLACIGPAAPLEYIVPADAADARTVQYMLWDVHEHNVDSAFDAYVKDWEHPKLHAQFPTNATVLPFSFFSPEQLLWQVHTNVTVLCERGSAFVLLSDDRQDDVLRMFGTPLHRFAAATAVSVVV
jgi:hypothetical protein